jgi:hypothetical protein
VTGAPAAGRRAVWIGTALAVAWFWLVATGFHPWDLFERGPFTSDFYDVQARALAHGHLDVPAGVAGIEGYVVGGRTHFYYGITPALARLPIAAVTDALDGRLVVLSQLGGIAVAALAAGRLLRRAASTFHIDLPQWMVAGFAFGVGSATPLLWLAARPLVYHEAELWGAALAILGFDRVVAWWSSRRTVDLVWAGAVAALAASTRGSSGIGPALALGGLALLLAVRRSGRVAVWAALAAATPVLLYGAVNLARFGTPLSIPFDRQVLNDFSAQRRAALAANGGTLFGGKFVPTTLLQYLRPDTVRPSSLLPWLRWGPPARVVGGVTFDTVDRAASLPVGAPWLLGLSVPGVWAMVRRRVPAAWAACLAGGVLAAVPTLAIAFVAQRYLADLVPPLVVAGAVGVPVTARWPRPWRRVAAVAAGVLAVIALGANAALAVAGQRLYLLPDPADERGFVGLQYDVYDRIPGGPPPHLSFVDELGPVAADGRLAVVGDCDALFRSDGTNWQPLELRPGGRFRQVVAGRLAPGTAVTGDGWAVVVGDAGDRRVEVEYRADNGVTARSDPIRASGEDVVLDVTADPTEGVVRVTSADEELLSTFLAPADGPVRPGPGWRPEPGSAPLCERLVERAQRGSSSTTNWKAKRVGHAPTPARSTRPSTDASAAAAPGSPPRSATPNGSPVASIPTWRQPWRRARRRKLRRVKKRTWSRSRIPRSS